MGRKIIKEGEKFIYVVDLIEDDDDKTLDLSGLSQKDRQLFLEQQPLELEKGIHPKMKEFVKFLARRAVDKHLKT